MTLVEAAHRRGCSVSAIRNAIEDGRLVPYDSPSGETHVWAADVDAMDPPRHGNRSSGEPVLTVEEIPGDDEALRKELGQDEIDFINFSLSYTCARARLHIDDKPVSQRLLRRFYRLASTPDPQQGEPP